MAPQKGTVIAKVFEGSCLKAEKGRAKWQGYGERCTFFGEAEGHGYSSPLTVADPFCCELDFARSSQDLGFFGRRPRRAKHKSTAKVNVLGLHTTAEEATAKGTAIVAVLGFFGEVEGHGHSCP